MKIIQAYFRIMLDGDKGQNFIGRSYPYPGWAESEEMVGKHKKARLIYVLINPKDIEKISESDGGLGGAEKDIKCSHIYFKKGSDTYHMLGTFWGMLEVPGSNEEVLQRILDAPEVENLPNLIVEYPEPKPPVFEKFKELIGY